MGKLCGEAPVVQLLFDPRHNVLMTRLYGTYVEPDITLDRPIHRACGGGHRMSRRRAAKMRAMTVALAYNRPEGAS